MVTKGDYNTVALTFTIKMEKEGGLEYSAGWYIMTGKHWWICTKKVK
jgi:hypothetical protein